MRDVINLGRSELVPYKFGEGFRKRHQRRMVANFSRLPVLQKFCNTFGITFIMQDSDRRWTFIKGCKQVDWWPSTAKLVINSDWHSGLHCQDHWQCQSVLKQVFGI
jgi:hypothetical protein